MSVPITVNKGQQNLCNWETDVVLWDRSLPFIAFAAKDSTSGMGLFARAGSIVRMAQAYNRTTISPKHLEICKSVSTLSLPESSTILTSANKDDLQLNIRTWRVPRKIFLNMNGFSIRLFEVFEISVRPEMEKVVDGPELRSQCLRATLQSAL